MLGDGFAVGAPSITAKGEYKIIRGTIDDLNALKPMLGVADLRQQQCIPKGQRNTTLFRRLLPEAIHCDDYEALLDVAATINMDCIPPLSQGSVTATAKKVWEYQVTGRNWSGRKAKTSTNREELMAFRGDPYALYLLQFLRVSHAKRVEPFAICHEAVSKSLGWNRRTVAGRIRSLIETGHVELIHKGSGKGDPHRYRLTKKGRIAESLS